jgi:hypothetical protein
MNRALAIAVCSALGAAGCGDDEPLEEDLRDLLSVEELMKPETCRECHPVHHEEWSGSMHAYASIDPVFLAMNRRGQQETQGKLGTFCVNCHAPMAVRTGATSDGLNMPELGPELQGVTCYFCHNVASVDGTHNAQLTLAMDHNMRGGITDPVRSGAHRSGYSPLMDNRELESASLCGACHDIVTSPDFAPATVPLERTFDEWQMTLFNRPISEGGRACSFPGCHMLPRPDERVANAPNVFTRIRHNHEFPGVDIALDDFPQRERQREAVQQLLDASTVRADICVAALPQSLSVMRILLENLTGHSLPSGAAQDRRMWVEVIATGANARGENVSYSSGIVPDGVPVTATLDADPDLWLLRDRVIDGEGREAHMFWDVAEYFPETIPGPSRSLDNFSNATDARRYPRQGLLTFIPDRVTLRVRVRPVGLDVIDDLIKTGHDPGIRDQIPTFDISPTRRVSDPPWPPTVTLEWTPALAANSQYGFSGEIDRAPARCVSAAPPR